MTIQWIKWTAASLLVTPSLALATIVQVQTSLGNFEINLFDEATPATVANFLGYVNADDYSNALFHRSVPGFVVQGGGFTLADDGSVDAIPTLPPVVNEPKYSNVRGTVAMAKLPGDPNSATNQWFINLVNNGSKLDRQNGGFTVFGQVSEEGMAVVDAIAALQTYNVTATLSGEPFAGAFTNTPLQTATGEDLTEDNWVLIEAITVLDTAPDTAANLSPAPVKKKKGGAIGLLGIFALLGLLLTTLRVKTGH